MEYIVRADTIIFDPEFNNVLDGYNEILSKIKKIPTQLKKIFCEEKYPFANYFKNMGIEVSTYSSCSYEK